MCSSWAHPWALSRILGPVTSLGSSLNDRHSPWASGQLACLESAGEGPGRLDKASGPEQARTGWHNTLTHSFVGYPLKVLFWTFWALHIFWHIWQFWQFLAVMAVLAISGPTLATKMSQGLLGLCCLIETRDRIERITWTAVLFD